MNKMVWAHYYPWYESLQEWSSPMLKDRPQTLYVSQDPAAMARHIEQAQSAGIDGFISSWWGPGTREDNNLGPLLNLAQARNFYVTIHFETLDWLGQPRNAEEIYNMLVYFITTYREHPALFKVRGKPVIPIWASQTVPLETWRDIFSRLRAQNLDAFFLAMSFDISLLDVFDGLHQ
jgi:hypothetical protein